MQPPPESKEERRQFPSDVPAPTSRQEDLHGFDVLTALTFAETRVREAFAHGYRQIEFTHGAADVIAPVEDGRGRIKWELRRLLESGALDAWVDPARSWPKSGSLVMALRANPRPHPTGWSPEPRRAHR